MIITKNYFSTFLRLALCFFVTILFMSLLSSSSYAFTYSEFYDFVEETYTNGEQPSSLNNQLETFLRSDVQTFLTTNTTLLNMFPNLTTSNNLSFIITKEYNTGMNFRLVMYEFEDCDCTIAIDTSYQNTPKCNLTNIVNCLYAARINIYINNGVPGTNQVENLKTSSTFTSHWTRNANMTGLIQSTDFTNNTSLVFSNEYNTIQPVAFEVYPLDESLENGKEVVRLQYRQKDLYLGHFINFVDNNVTELEYTLSFNNGTWSEHGYTELDNNNYNGNQNLYMSGDSVYVRSLLLNYYNTYEFNWGAWEGDSLLNQGTLYYYVLPVSAVVSGGVVVSSGDADPYSAQDQTIDFLNDLNDYSTVATDIDAFVSGDLAGTLGFQQYDSSGDIWRATIINFTDQVADALMYSGDPYYDISFHGQATTRIYASDFTTPETAWKQFVRLALIFGCLYAIYYQLFTIFNALTCGAPDDAIANLSPDIYLYRM